MSQMRHDYCRAHDLRVAGLLAYASQPMAAPPPLLPVYPCAGQPALRQRALRWPLGAIFDTCHAPSTATDSTTPTTAMSDRDTTAAITGRLGLDYTPRRRTGLAIDRG